MSEQNSTRSFRERTQAAVDTAVDNDVPTHRIEGVLQEEAQNVREDRRVYEVLVFECPNANCKETHTELIDRSTILCDICDQRPPLVGSGSDGETDGEIFRFDCNKDFHSTRTHVINSDDLQCSVHGPLLSLIESYTTEEGLGAT